MGRNTAGVKAMDVEEGDEVVGMCHTEPDRDQVLAVCERGYGKRTPLSEFRTQNRGGKGIILIETSDRNGPVVGIALVKPVEEVMLITDRGQTIRIRVDEIRETGRVAQGVKLMSVEDDERVVAVEPIGESNAADAETEATDAEADSESTDDGVSNGAVQDIPDAADGESSESSEGGDDSQN
jgi:DNA gyrase subunit A